MADPATASMVAPVVGAAPKATAFGPVASDIVKNIRSRLAKSQLSRTPAAQWGQWQPAQVDPATGHLFHAPRPGGPFQTFLPDKTKALLQQTSDWAEKAAGVASDIAGGGLSKKVAGQVEKSVEDILTKLMERREEKAAEEVAGPARPVDDDVQE
jgi:hypothetical protein